MELKPISTDPQVTLLMVEVFAEDSQDATPALIDGIGRDAASALSSEGYSVQSLPIKPGQRGGFLIQVITFLTANQGTLDITSALITILTPVVLTAKHLLKAYERRVSEDSARQQPIKISVDIDGAHISLESSEEDLQNAELAAEKLAKRLQADHPTVAAKVTPRSEKTLRASVPKMQPPRRR